MRWNELPRSTQLLAGVAGVSAIVLMVSALVLTQSARQAEETRSVGQVAAVTLSPDETLQITFIGDSLTAGLHATTERDTYRYLTATALAGDGPYEQGGAGIVGGTVENTLTSNQEFPEEQDVYVVELGTNDAREVDFRTFGVQYEALLDRVRDASPNAALICLGTWRPPSVGANHDLMIRQQCESHGGVFRRLTDLEAKPTNIGPRGRKTFEGRSDNFHPNNAGHAAISGRALTAIDVDRQG